MYQLSNEQKRIWLSEQIYPSSSAYIIGGCMSLAFDIDVSKMNSVLNKMVASNDCFRIRIKKKGDEVFQDIVPFYERKFDFFDFSKEDNRETKYREWVDSCFKEPFVIEDHELFYIAIYKIRSQECGVLVKLHHLIADGWTTGLISREIGELYENLNHIEKFVDEAKPSYLTYLNREKKYFESEEYIKDDFFWNTFCGRIDEKNFYKSHFDIKGTRKVYGLDDSTAKKINTICERYKVSSNLLLMCALSIIIHKINNQKNVVMGTPIYNRTNRIEKQTMGMFTSLLPVMIEIEPDMKFADFLKEANLGYLRCMRHYKYPYDQIAKKAIQGKGEFDSIYRYSVNVHNASYTITCGGYDVMIDEAYSGNQIHSLQFVFKVVNANKYVILADYKEEYSEEEIDAMIEMIKLVISQLASEPQKMISEIELANAEYVKKQLKNGGALVNYEVNSVIEIVEKVADEEGDKIALEYNNKTMKYRELIDRAKQFANYLRDINVNRGERIAVKLKHNFNLFIAILGILKYGATYVPIDLECPIKRTEFILRDSGCKKLICETDSMIFDTDIQVININKISFPLYSRNYESIYDKNDLAYIIYTSGSSGTPKGVMIENKGLINYVMWANKEYLTENDVIACYSSIAFDLTVTSIFMPLVSGNKIVIYEESDNDEYILNRIVNEKKCNIIKLTPSHIKILLNMNFDKTVLQKLIVGGENFPVALCEKMSKAYGIREIYNEYGPTEATVGCMIYKYDADTCESVPIGRAIDNMKEYIMDIYGRILPKGIRGELCIAGIGLARGYVNQEKLSVNKFVRNVYDSDEVIYKSGDIAKYIDDNVMVYCGRIDEQIKVNGHRIEVSEISNCLIQLEGIVDLAVRVLNEGDSKRIVAYVVCDGYDLNEQSIKKSMKKVLNEYMIPSRIHVVKHIPITTNGKIDFNRLDEITENYEVAGELLQTDEVSEAIKRVLGVHNIYTDSNFHVLGGDSIKAIQLSSELRSKGLRLEVLKILNATNISEMIESIESIKEDSREEKAEHLSILNTPIIDWFFLQKMENKERYFQYVCLKLMREYDSLKEILEIIINQHDVFGYKFNESGISKICYDHRVLDYIEIEYDGQLCEKNIKEELFRLNIEFDLQEGNLFKAILLKSKSSGINYLILCAHHLVIDSFSWQIILSEIETLYKNGLDSSQLIKTDEYLKWANYLHKKKQINSVLYKENETEQKNNPTDFFGANIITAQDGNVDIISRVIEEKIVERISKVDLKKYRLSFEEFLEIAFCLALKDESKKNELVFEVENNGRKYDTADVDVSASIGWYTCFLLKNILMDDERDSIDDMIKSLKEQLKKESKYDFEKSELRYIRFNYLGNLDSILAESLLFEEAFFGLNNESQHLSALCEVNCYIMKKRLVIDCSYERNRYGVELIGKFMDRFVYYLELLDEYMYQKEDYAFTPSDFTDISITQDNLDTLFD